MSLILGLESSCDETAAALVTSDRRILAHKLAGQEAAHAPYGGVVPEIAARAHVEILPGLVGPAVERAAEAGDPRAVPLPRPLAGSSEPHFSFAGLKSAVLRARDSGLYSAPDIAASFQQAAVDCLVDRTKRALGRVPQARALVV